MEKREQSAWYVLWIAIKTLVYNKWHKARIQHNHDEQTIDKTDSQVDSANSVEELIDNMHGLKNQGDKK